MALVQSKASGHGGSANPSITLDAAPTAGNVVVVAVANGNQFITQTTASGWTQLGTRAANDVTLGIYGRVCDGTETATLQPCTLSASQGGPICAGEFTDTSLTVLNSIGVSFPTGSTSANLDATVGGVGFALVATFNVAMSAWTHEDWTILDGADVGGGAGGAAFFITDVTNTPLTVGWSPGTKGAAVGVTLESTGGGTAAEGSAAGSFSFSGVASGAKTPKGSGSGGFAFAGSASGTKPQAGAASGGYAFAGSATGSAPAAGVSQGSASGSYAFTGAAQGAFTARGAASGGFALAGTAEGQGTVYALHRGYGLAAHFWVGSATGKRTQRGSASGSFGFAGTAAGEKREHLFRFTPPTYQKQAWQPALLRRPRYNLTESQSVIRVNGVLTSFKSPTAKMLTDSGIEGVDYFIGGHVYDVPQAVADELTAAGFTVTELVHLPTHHGSAVGGYHFTGSGAGMESMAGSAAGGYAFAGSASGVGRRSSEGVGTYAFDGSATGVAPRKGSAVGAVAFAGSATGGKTAIGTGSGTFTFAGSSTGRRTTRGSAIGLLGFSGVTRGTAQSPRTNLMPNPSFEINTTGWASVGVSMVRDTAQAYVGSASLKTTTAAFNGAQYAATPTGASGMPVTPGVSYTLSARIKHAVMPVSGSNGHHITMEFYNASGGYVASPWGSAQYPATTDWVQDSFTVTAPATAAYATVYLGNYNDSGSATVVWFDAVMFERASSAGTYFDGSTADTATAVHDWTGTPHASASRLYPVPDKKAGASVGRLSFVGSANGTS